MITYIVKTVLCSGLFIVVYYLVLEREKIYRFNRGYLLLGIALSFIIPLISIRVRSAFDLVPAAVYYTDTIIQNAALQPSISNGNESNSLKHVFLLIYGAVTLFFLAKFFLNIFSLFRRIRQSNSVNNFNASFILTKEKVIPYSFLKYIFINNEDFKNERIESEILNHELTHVRQKHSIDILFIELLLVFAWINPFLFLYRKAIQLNHEFLADESVIQNSPDTNSYQLLLIGKANHINRLWLSSQFNYIQTKKRIIMMSKQTSFRTAIMKQIALIPVLALAIMLFTTKAFAQVHGTTIKHQQAESTQTGVSHELIKEYQDILIKHTEKNANGTMTFRHGIPKEEKERLEELFFQMSNEQQEQQLFVFVPESSMVLQNEVPSQEQIESFKDAKTYGVWIDNQKVNNDALANYKNTDFADVFVSKLMLNATNYGKHVYQVNLLTNKWYEEYRDRMLASKENLLIPRLLKHESDSISHNNTTPAVYPHISDWN